MTAPVPADVISRLKAVLGPDGWSEDPDRLAPKLVEWRDRWVGTTPFLALPRTTADVAAVVGICFEAGQPITTQGGNTGLVGGQIPQGEILLSTERLRAIREVEPYDDVLVAEAGVTLAQVHEAAAEVRRRFPLGLASEGSATVGGVVSTNAGGTQVLRYGMTRNLVLGLEAVLPNGEVWNGLKRLRKDNTGYDLKQMLIGAEGTLGVVTAAALKLFPLMASRAVAMIGVSTPEAALDLLTRAKAETGGAVEAFELMGRLGVEFALRNIAGTRDPLAEPHPWYVLAEFASGEPGSATAAMERFLEAGLEAGLVRDAVVAQTDGQAKALWAIRENQSPAPEARGRDVEARRRRAGQSGADVPRPGRPRRWRPSPPARASPRSGTLETETSTTTSCGPTADRTPNIPRGATPGRASCTTSWRTWAARSAPSTAWAR